MTVGYCWSTPRGLDVGPLPEAELAALVELGLVGPETPLFDEHRAPLGPVRAQPEMLAALARNQLRASMVQAMAPWTPSPEPDAPPMRIVTPAPKASTQAEVSEEMEAEAAAAPSPLPSRGWTFDLDVSSERVAEDTHDVGPPSAAMRALAAAPTQPHPLPSGAIEAAPESVAAVEPPKVVPSPPPPAEASPPAEAPPGAADAVNADFDPDFDPWSAGLLDEAAPAPASVPASVSPAMASPPPAPRPPPTAPTAPSAANTVPAEWVDDDVFADAGFAPPAPEPPNPAPLDLHGVEAAALRHLREGHYGEAEAAFERLAQAKHDRISVVAARAFCRFARADGHSAKVAQYDVVQNLLKNERPEPWALLFASRMNLGLDRLRVAEEQLDLLHKLDWSAPELRAASAAHRKALDARRAAVRPKPVRAVAPGESPQISTPVLVAAGVAVIAALAASGWVLFIG